MGSSGLPCFTSPRLVAAHGHAHVAVDGVGRDAAAHRLLGIDLEVQHVDADPACSCPHPPWWRRRYLLEDIWSCPPPPCAGLRRSARTLPQRQTAARGDPAASPPREILRTPSCWAIWRNSSRAATAIWWLLRLRSCLCSSCTSMFACRAPPAQVVVPDHAVEIERRGRAHIALQRRDLGHTLGAARPPCPGRHWP